MAFRLRSEGGRIVSRMKVIKRYVARWEDEVDSLQRRLDEIRGIVRIPRRILARELPHPSELTKTA